MNKEFKTVEEIVNDLDFQNYVKSEFTKFVEKRKNRVDAPDGMKYRRDWYDRMSDAGILSADYFIKNIGLIWEHKSNLNSEFRNIIKYVCGIAFQNLVILNNKP